MKFRNPGRIVVASALLIASSLMLTACGTNTVDFLYVATNKLSPGEIDVFEVNRVSGSLRPIKASPFPAGKNPVALAASPSGKNLYVVNSDDDTVVQYAIGSDGKLYPQNTINTAGAQPIALAVDPSGSALYVVDTYAPGYNVLNPGPGDVTTILLEDENILPASNSPYTSNGKSYTYTSPSYVTIGYLPTAAAAVGTASTTSPFAANLYVTGFTKAGTGQLYGFTSTVTVSDSSTAYTASATLATAGVVTMPSGSSPSSVAVDPLAKYVYVTDKALNALYAYQLNGTQLPAAAAGTYATGSAPSSVTVVENSKSPSTLDMLLVANYNDGTVFSYLVNPATGLPKSSTPASTGVVAAGPIAIAADQQLGQYAYTANFGSATVSGLMLNQTTGGLVATQKTPYGTNTQPTAIAIIPHDKNPLL